MGEIAASVLLKLFINYSSIIIKDATPLTSPIAGAELLFSNVQHIIYDHREQRNIGKIN